MQGATKPWTQGRVFSNILQLSQYKVPGDGWRLPSISDPHCRMAHPAAFQDKYSFTEGLALVPVHTQLMCKHIAHLLGDYPSHDDKNCVIRASTIPLSVPKRMQDALRQS